MSDQEEKENGDGNGGLVTEKETGTRDDEENQRGETDAAERITGLTTEPEA